MNFLSSLLNLIALINILFISLIQKHIFKKDYVVITKRSDKDKKKKNSKYDYAALVKKRFVKL